MNDHEPLSTYDRPIMEPIKPKLKVTAKEEFIPAKPENKEEDFKPREPEEPGKAKVLKFPNKRPQDMLPEELRRHVAHVRKILRKGNRNWPPILVPVEEKHWPPNIPVGDDGERIKVLRSNAFLVQVFKHETGHRLSINRTWLNDQGRWDDGITWDDLQNLKNQAGFGDRLAVEVYPPNDCLVNVANMRHLWVGDFAVPYWKPEQVQPSPKETE